MSDMDKIALRREARRRRILENSEERMKKLLGQYDYKAMPVSLAEKENESFAIKSNLLEDSVGAEVGDYFAVQNKELVRKPLPSLCHSEPEKVRRRLDLGGCKPENDKVKSEVDEVKYKADEIEEVSNLQSFSGVGTTEHKKPSFLLFGPFPLIITAVLVRILILCNAGSLFYNNILIPFVSLTIVRMSMECSLFPDSNSTKNFIVASLVLSGVPKNMVAVVANILWGVQKVILDFAVYLFTFIVCHVCEISLL